MSGNVCTRGALNVRTAYILEEQLGHVLALLTPQNALIAEVQLHTGLRIGDVLALRREQIARKFWITEQKTKKRRQVGLTDDLIKRILRQAGKSEWAFPGRYPSKPKTRQAVWVDIKRAAAACRLPQNCGTHSMRKIYAVELMEKYGDIQKVQRALNHSDMNVTLLYAMADKMATEKQRTKSRRR
jgi:integrase